MSRDRIASLGGKARALKLSAAKRRKIAQNAAKARWGRHELRTEAPDPWNGLPIPSSLEMR